MATTEYTAEGFEQETIDERIEALLEAWGVDTDPDPENYREYEDAMMRLEDERWRAYELAVSFPDAINTDLFLQIMEARGYQA